MNNGISLILSDRFDYIIPRKEENGIEIHIERINERSLETLSEEHFFWEEDLSYYNLYVFIDNEDYCNTITLVSNDGYESTMLGIGGGIVAEIIDKVKDAVEEKEGKSIDKIIEETLNKERDFSVCLSENDDYITYVKPNKKCCIDSINVNIKSVGKDYLNQIFHYAIKSMNVPVNLIYQLSENYSNVHCNIYVNLVNDDATNGLVTFAITSGDKKYDLVFDYDEIAFEGYNLISDVIDKVVEKERKSIKEVIKEHKYI